jgi:hypothetical protein
MSFAPRPPTTVGAFQSPGTHQLCRTKSRSDGIQQLSQPRRQAASRTGLAVGPLQAQSVGVRRLIRVLAALLSIAVLHGGVAAAWSASPERSPPTLAGTAHQVPDAMPDDCSGGHPADGSRLGCCDSSSSCDCGCTATPVAVLRLTPAVRDWVTLEDHRAEDAPGFRRMSTGAPFRPPA